MSVYVQPFFVRRLMCSNILLCESLRVLLQSGSNCSALEKKKKTGVSTKPLLVLQLQNIKADILLIYVATTNLPSGP